MSTQRHLHKTGSIIASLYIYRVSLQQPTTHFYKKDENGCKNNCQITALMPSDGTCRHCEDFSSLPVASCLLFPDEDFYRDVGLFTDVSGEMPVYVSYFLPSCAHAQVVVPASTGLLTLPTPGTNLFVIFTTVAVYRTVVGPNDCKGAANSRCQRIFSSN